MAATSDTPPAYASSEAVPPQAPGPRADVEAQKAPARRPAARGLWLAVLLGPPLALLVAAAMQIAYLYLRETPSAETEIAAGPSGEFGTRCSYTSFRQAALFDATENAVDLVLWLTYCLVVLSRGKSIVRFVARWSAGGRGSQRRQELAAVGAAFVVQFYACMLHPLRVLLVTGRVSLGHVTGALSSRLPGLASICVLPVLVRGVVSNRAVSLVIVLVAIAGMYAYALEALFDAHVRAAIPIEELLATRAYGLAAAQVLDVVRPVLPASAVFVSADATHRSLVSARRVALVSALLDWPVAPGTTAADLAALQPLFARRGVPFAYGADGSVYYGHEADSYAFLSSLLGAFGGREPQRPVGMADVQMRKDSMRAPQPIASCCAVESDGLCVHRNADGVCVRDKEESAASIWEDQQYGDTAAARLKELASVTAHEAQHVSDRWALAALHCAQALPTAGAAALPWGLRLPSGPLHASALAVALSPLGGHALSLLLLPAFSQLAQLFERRADAAALSRGLDVARARLAYMRRGVWASLQADAHAVWAFLTFSHPTSVSRIRAAMARISELESAAQVVGE